MLYKLVLVTYPLISIILGGFTALQTSGLLKKKKFVRPYNVAVERVSQFHAQPQTGAYSCLSKYPRYVDNICVARNKLFYCLYRLYTWILGHVIVFSINTDIIDVCCFLYLLFASSKLTRNLPDLKRKLNRFQNFGLGNVDGTKEYDALI